MEDKVPYKKSFLTHEEQLNLLKSRGLIIEDENRALHLLEKISYYRLSGYWYPLLADKETHVFKKGASFDTAFKLYCFDKELRRLILGELEKIEVAVRAHMIYIISGYFGAFWTEEKAIFPNQNGHDEIIAKITSEYERSDEKFIEAFKYKYSNPLPPSWMLLEITSFGSLSLMYQQLKPGKTKREIADKFGLDDATFMSWMHTMVYVRNVCAHHSRLWNRSLSIRPLRLQNPQNTWLKNKQTSNARVFYFASALVYMLNIINPNSTFKERFINLITSFKIIDFNAMGFCDEWEKEPLWLSNNKGH